MSKLVAVFVTIVLSSVLLFGQSSKDTVELKKLLDEFLVGAGTNDAQMHDRFWAEDLIYTRSSGSRINKAELMKGVRSAPKGKTDAPTTIYKAEDIQVHLYGTTAVVAFCLVGTTTKMDGKQDVNQYFNTGTFIKRKGRWQAVAWQATVIPKSKE